nr:5-enolpyruvylshikimate-3-phosphate synthase [Burkholderia pseudomallei]
MAFQWPRFPLQPWRHVTGHLRLPGDKSISNRSLLLGALAEGVTEVTGLLDSDDARAMLNALRDLGVVIEGPHQGRCTVHGVGLHGLKAPPGPLFLGNAGTAMRPLSAALALQPFDTTLTGDPRMSERPINRLVDALREMGAVIEYLAQEGYPPLTIRGGGSVSSQFLTALLMTAPMASAQIKSGLLLSKPYIDITLNVMPFGVPTRDHTERIFAVSAIRYPSPAVLRLEGDATSASYFLAAAGIKGVPVTGIGRHSMQGDSWFPRALRRMGARSCGSSMIVCPRGELRAAVRSDSNSIPDAAMTLATRSAGARWAATANHIRVAGEGDGSAVCNVHGAGGGWRASGSRCWSSWLPSARKVVLRCAVPKRFPDGNVLLAASAWRTGCETSWIPAAPTRRRIVIEGGAIGS